MSFKLVLVLLALAGIIGLVAGYFLRWLVSLGRKGSMELEIKQIMLDAREEAKGVVREAEKKAGEIEGKLRDEFREKEDRIGKKEQYLDERELGLDKEAERVKG